MTDFSLLLVVFSPLVIALIGACIPKTSPRGRDVWYVCGTAYETLIAALVFLRRSVLYEYTITGFAGFGLHFINSPFQGTYVAVTASLWLMTMCFAMEYLKHDHARGRYCFYNLITLSGVMGVFLSADLFTTFVFFEIMSFASYPLVIHEETPGAMKAGETYLGVAVISGMVLLVGIFMLKHEAGTLNFYELRTFFEDIELSPLAFVGGTLVLLGFGAKAGMFPLHVWLPQAHPVAPSPASALLSGILTKTGVFGIIVMSANVFMHSELFGEILLTLAVITMFLGALLALFSTNLKRTLACSSMSQIGFILTGVSFTVLLHNDSLAQNGAFLHMMNHSFIKLVLFMCAGVVAMNAHALELNEIRGYGRRKPFLAFVFLIGALSIMGIPLFGGYISKTLIHEGIVEYIEEYALTSARHFVFKAVEWIFLLSGGLTVAYMTKLFVCIFIEKNEDETRQKTFDGQKDFFYLSLWNRPVFLISCVPLMIIGLAPGTIFSEFSWRTCGFFNSQKIRSIEIGLFESEYDIPDFFGLESLEGAAISIGIGIVIYFALVRTVFIRKGKYVDLWPARLDLENGVYRPLLVDGTNCFVKYLVSPIAYFFEWLITSGTVGFIRFVVRPIAYFFEFVIVDGTLIFTLYVVRFFALMLDYILLFLNKTVLKSHVYKFKEETFSMRVGELLDKLLRRKKKHEFAEKMDSFTDTVGKFVSAEYSSFSFAFAMISLGIIIILLFAIFGK